MNRNTSPRTYRIRLTCTVLFALVGAACLAITPAHAQAERAAPATVVLQSSAASNLRPIAPGFADWVSRRIAAAGVPIRGSGESSRIVDPRPRSTRTLLAIAKQQQARQAVLIDLGFENGRIDVLLRVHRVEDGRLLGAGRAAGRAALLAATAATAVERVLPLVGGQMGASVPTQGFDLGQLSARSRALASLDTGDYATAWRTLDEDRTPDADALRSVIEAAAAAPEVGRLERVRLRSARGQADQAWKEILREASEQLYAAEPDTPMLLVAGEVQLARGKLHEAQAYFERSLEIEPDNLRATLGLGRSLSDQQNQPAALTVLERARSIAPDSTDATEWLTEIPGTPAKLAARAHLDAGVAAGRRMDPIAAKRHIDKAISLDPNIEVEAREHAGSLQLEFGEPDAAIQSYRDAIEIGGATPERQRGLAHSLHAIGDTEGAEAAYKAALELQHNDPESLLGLGDLYNQTERYPEARVLLEQVVETRPEDAAARRSLAHTLHRQGELDAAIPLLASAEEIAGPDTKSLRELARIQRAQNDPEQAERTLKRAVGLDPTSVSLRQELAVVMQAQGREADSAKQLELVERLGGNEALAQARSQGARSAARSDGRNQHFDALIASFGLAPAGAEKTVVLGVREARTWQGEVLEWLAPTSLNLAKVESDLRSAIEPHYDIQNVVPAESLERLTARLFAFGRRDGLDADTIAAVNGGLASDSVFLAVVQRGNWLTPSVCPDESQLHVEVRRLGGDTGPTVDILANETCLSEGVAQYAGWNWKAAGVLGGLATLLLFPLLRGFGRVVVRVKLPDNTRAFFSVSLTKKPRKVKATREKKESDARDRFNQKLRSMGRKERRLSKSRDVTFSMIPARSREYFVTVHGPLYHSISEQLIGDFLEERTVRVTRGQTANVDFDLQPKECAVEVMIYHGERALNGAQVAVAGQPQSLRYTSNGAAFIYLPKGSYTIVAGARDRAAEREINIDSFDPMPLMIDLASESGLVFRSCSDAVQPFLEGNFDAAAIALEAAEQAQLAQLMRARGHQQRGDFTAASKVLKEAGELTRAADLLAEHNDRNASAGLYEEAGDFERAAEIHRASGDILAAARAYEAGYDYARAAECYRELGDLDNVLTLLEKSSDHFAAGQLAIELGENARAIQNLQQVERRHPHYSEACRSLAAVLIDEGNSDFALEKLDEALKVGSIESFPIELRDSYSGMLEEAGRFGDAIAALQSVRRENIHYPGVNERIESLKQQLTQLEERHTRVVGQTTAGITSPTELTGESRYEIMEQVGAGGMGVVYKARDKHLGRLVAMKRLPENLREHPAAVKFFEREARSAAVLNHPNIVTVYDAGQEGSQYFITMELLEGTPLDTIVKKRGALPPLVVAQLGVQIATGLHFAHRNKIIHRDIKTANLFLTRDKIVKIMDFGLAKMVEEVRKGATVIGGTPFFMAPEQAAGDEDIDHRADLYALGITLFQLSTGALPFTEGDVSYHHRHTPAPDPREFNAELPEPLAELILQLLQKRPEDRLQKAADVVRVLQAMVDEAAARRAP